MSRSGCLIPTSMRICATTQRARACGATAGTTIPKRAFFQSAAAAVCALNVCPLTAHPKWRTILWSPSSRTISAKPWISTRAYLAGYFASKYEVDAQQSISRANERIKNSTETAFRDSVRGYATVLPDGGSVRFSGGQAKYALYPVWILNTTWQDKKYVFAMNGQTGKFTGNLPVDKRAYRRWLFGLGAACSAAVFAVTFLIWLL